MWTGIQIEYEQIRTKPMKPLHYLSSIRSYDENAQTRTITYE
jgi:hypothetical protein